MKSFIKSKPFVSRKSLQEFNGLCKSKIIEEFECSMKSNSSVLTDKLYEHFKKNYDIIFNENEMRRQSTMTSIVEKCGSMFMELMNKQLDEYMNKQLDNSFVESKTLEKLFISNKEMVFNQFKDAFDGEEEYLFVNDLFNVRLI